MDVEGCKLSNQSNTVHETASYMIDLIQEKHTKYYRYLQMGQIIQWLSVVIDSAASKCKNDLHCWRHIPLKA